MSLVVGGIVPPQNVVGRVRDVADVMASLSGGGSVLVGDRRHGKTSLARVAQFEAASAGAVVIAASAERETYADFVGSLATELGRLEPAWAQEMARLRLSLSAGPIKIERGRNAASVLDDLLDRAVSRAAGRQVVLFVDEVTILARNLERHERGAGDNFLHMLRRFRQKHGSAVATVLSGSIGFHHVSPDAPSTVNDIRKITVGPIRSDHAAYLAECLLLGEGVQSEHRRDVAEAVAAAAENIPYYIQHLVAATVIAWRATGKLPRAEDIPRFVDTAIEDRADPWDLKHYRNRLSDYYGTDATAVGRLLDVYAHAPGRLTIDDALTRTQGEGIDITDRVQLVAFVERLELDHYLERIGDADKFASALVQRAWRAMRR
ncbi:ATP-binding protein [Mycolicibacterium fluoranthenivorans]|uniref:ATP-binding protein n=1 Tax=Mycolicibacterium fluoranthenivorans TaxID=258505 RepID=A0A7G8PDK6_9MYCO|nr:ATP-binding protein [Mycolicibacterium fluoranthenivorans]QNJ92422.1 ATP-binding protein [Mycolicibacterium fluoranthenivorans]